MARKRTLVRDLGVPPLVALATLLPRSLIWDQLRPEVVVTHDAKIGFAIPQLRLRHGVLATWLAVGFVGGVWRLA